MRDISRRRVLSSSATLLTGGVAGAAAVGRIASDTAAAENAQTDFTVEGDAVTIRQGEIVALPLTLAIEWAYALPSGKSPARAVLTATAGPSESELSPVASTETDVTFLEESGSHTFETDVLEAGGLTADGLRPPEGDTAESTIAVGSEIQVFSESDLLLAAASRVDTATVSVTVPEYDASQYGTLAGAGSVSVQVE